MGCFGTLAQAEDPSPATRIGDPWPLETCVVSGEKLGSMGDPIIHLHEGREVRFCCTHCIEPFTAEPAKYLAKADATIIEQQKPHYPLKHCIIDTGEALSADESKNSYSVVGNRLFIYCCPPCDKKVRAEPAKHFATLDAAARDQQIASYPLDVCVISGQPLGTFGETTDRVIANRLVRLCSPDCVAELEANPSSALTRISGAIRNSPREH